MKYVFLGGTAANNHWRKRIIQELRNRGIQPEQIFDPIVEDWTPADQKREDAAKLNPEYYLTFVLGSPDPQFSDQRFTSAYSLYEATESLFTKPERTIILFDYTGFDHRTAKHLSKIEKDMRLHKPDSVAISYEDLIDQIVFRIFR